MKNDISHRQKPGTDEHDRNGAHATSSPPGFRWTVKDAAPMSTSMVSILLVGLIGLGMALTNLLSRNSLEQARPSLLFILGAVSIEVLVLLGSVYYLGLSRRRQPWVVVGLRPLSRSWILVSVGLGLLAVPLGSFVTYTLQQLLGLSLTNTQLLFLVPEGLSWLGIGAMLLLVGVAVPFAEELFFRGVLYQALRDHWGPWLGATLSSLVFAGLHGSLLVGLITFLLGLLCVFAYEKSQSLWSAILIHTVNNSISLILLYSMLMTTASIPWV
jgi:uncharacterized protein